MPRRAKPCQLDSSTPTPQPATLPSHPPHPRSPRSVSLLKTNGEEAGGALWVEQGCPGGRWHCRRAAPFPRPGRLGTACGESVVSAVPNPKWLLRNGNPIKVLLVYLSSSGLFITVQMAATFARHSSVLARARRTEARAPRSLCVHLRGAGGRLLQRNRPGAGQRRLPAPQHPRTCQVPAWVVFAPGIGTRDGHWPLGTGHWNGVLVPGMSTGRSHRSFAQCLHGAFASGMGTGHWHWEFLIPGSVQGRDEQALEQHALV